MTNAQAGEACARRRITAMPIGGQSTQWVAFAPHEHDQVAPTYAEAVAAVCAVAGFYAENARPTTEAEVREFCREHGITFSIRESLCHKTGERRSYYGVGECGRCRRFAYDSAAEALDRYLNQSATPHEGQREGEECAECAALANGDLGATSDGVSPETIQGRVAAYRNVVACLVDALDRTLKLAEHAWQPGGDGVVGVDAVVGAAVCECRERGLDCRDGVRGGHRIAHVYEGTEEGAEHAGRGPDIPAALDDWKKKNGVGG